MALAIAVTARWSATGCATAATVTPATMAWARTASAFFLPHTVQHFGACGFGCGLHDIAAGRFARAAPNGLAAHGDGLGALTRFGGKALDQAHFNVLLGEVLNVGHKAFFVQTHQVDGSAIRPSAPGAADAVHIVFADVGDFVVDDVRQLVDIDTARGDVGSDQGAHIPALETGQRLGARRLTFIAVQGHGADAVFL